MSEFPKTGRRLELSIAAILKANGTRGRETNTKPDQVPGSIAFDNRGSANTEPGAVATGSYQQQGRVASKPRPGRYRFRLRIRLTARMSEFPKNWSARH
jgi:hypothetical protein